METLKDRLIGELLKFWRSEHDGWVGLVKRYDKTLNEYVLTEVRLEGKTFLSGDIYEARKQRDNTSHDGPGCGSCPQCIRKERNQLQAEIS